jgi:hypothetical protein
MIGRLKFVFEDEKLEEYVEHSYEVTHECWPQLVEKFFFFLRGASFPINHTEYVEHFADLLKEWDNVEADVVDKGD